MTIAAAKHDISDAALDAALRWAVVLCSGTAGNAEREAFERWLNAESEHQSAWRRMQMIEEEFVPARAAAASGTRALKSTEQQQRRKRQVTVGAGGVLSLLLGVGLLMHVLPDLSNWTADYATTAREQQRIELPGGAIVQLNAGTALDINRDTAGLIVQLHQGEILVDSAGADARNKPRVLTSDARFTPIGTRFVVTKMQHASELAVIEGVVAAEAADASDILEVTAGEQLHVSNGNMKFVASNGLTSGAWTDHIVEADNARLGDVLDVLSGWRRGWLRYDETVAGLRVTGVFRLDDTDSALLALERTLPIRIERTTDWWVSVTSTSSH